MAAPVLAKLSRPRLAAILPRERLFARLDECRQCTAVWVSGPPGAGKTTLTSSYLDARGLRALWYQVDGSDDDPATFFYYLGLGAKAAGLSKKTHLPLLTPEYLPDVTGFARRSFRTLCLGLPVPSMLVFDNMHEVPEASPLHSVIATALAELPPGLNAVLVSREAPTAPYARLRASRQLAEVGWDELRLSREEAGRIAAGQGIASADIDELVQRCDGWAAGLTLLLAHARATGRIADPPDLQQALFDYFAAELFDRLPGPTRQLLLCTALLPSVSATMAQRLVDRDDAGTILEGLRRNHLFVERAGSAPPSYRYHALFRQFLEARMRATLPRAECLQLRRDSARLLERAGDAGAALPLHLVAGEHDAAVRLVLAAAPGLAAQGRLQTLAGWIEALPPVRVDRLPWLVYWQGICALASNPPRARDRLEAAFERFAEAHDVVGRLLAAAAIIDTHMLEWGDYRRTTPWAREVLTLLDARTPFPDPRVELRALGSLIGAIVTVDPAHPRLMGIAERIAALLDSTPDVNARIEAAAMLLQYHTLLAHRDAEAGARLIAQTRPLLTDPCLLPLRHCHWSHTEATYLELIRYDEQQGNAAMKLALDIAQRNGLGFLAVVQHAHAAQFRLEASDAKGAAELLAAVTPTRDSPRHAVALYEGLQSWVALAQARTGDAVAHAQRHLDACLKTGASHPTLMALVWLANALAANGEAARAVEALRQARQANVTGHPLGDFSVDLIEADIHRAAGNIDEAKTLLRRALALGRRVRLLNTLQWLPQQMSRLCGFALEHDIETSFVTDWIRVRRMRPPSPDTVAWPWPLKIRCLGTFQILNDDEPLRFEGKARRKLLALLKALIVLGGVDVSEDRLIDIVWPEPLDGDVQKAFDIAAHRLRKLLGHDRALLIGDRRVSLNPELVWVDLWALERRLDALVPNEHGAPDPARLAAAAPAVLELYRGVLLDGEDAAWLLPVRNRVHGRFRLFIDRVGQNLEGAGRSAEAARLYEHAIGVDPLAESFYARLMVCLREQGRRAEAIDVFRRCRQVLSVTLGIKPGPATEAVHQTLFADPARPAPPRSSDEISDR